MGEWTIVINGSGPHHNYKFINRTVLVPDGYGDYERTTTDINDNVFDADLLTKEFVSFLKERGHKIISGTFTAGSITDATQPVYDPDPLHQDQPEPKE